MISDYLERMIRRSDNFINYWSIVLALNIAFYVIGIFYMDYFGGKFFLFFPIIATIFGLLRYYILTKYWKNN